MHNKKVRKPRIEKKRQKQAEKFANYVEWSVDLRAYLLEADYENIPLSIIRNQFKRRLKRRPNFAVATRMTSYVRWALSRD